jgi:hypothetical protein
VPTTTGTGSQADSRPGGGMLVPDLPAVEARSRAGTTTRLAGRARGCQQPGHPSFDREPRAAARVVPSQRQQAPDLFAAGDVADAPGLRQRRDQG